jgi:hypothetical protein
MKHITGRLSFLFTGIILAVTMAFLAVGRPEYCGQNQASRASFMAETDKAAPTLAPPQKVVDVRVEVDKPDIEIGWAQN